MNFPHAHITVEVGVGLSSLIDARNFCNEVIERQRKEGLSGKSQNVLWMRRERFDAVIVLDESRRLMFEAFLAGIPNRYGLHKGKSQRIYTIGIACRRDVHEARGNFELLLKAMNLEVSTKLVLPVTSEHFVNAKEVLTTSGTVLDRPMVAVQCPDSTPRRSWPDESIVKLSNLLMQAGYQTVLIGGNGQMRAADRLTQGTSIVNTVGKLGLLESAAAIDLMDCLVCPDSGPMHIAAAMGTFTVCLYTTRSNPVYTGPYGVNFVILASGNDTLSQITPEDVYSNILNFS